MSKPPEEPPTRNEMPLPMPTRTPPNAADSSVSVARGCCGMRAIAQVTAATDRMLRPTKRLPSINNPIISIGTL
ncbi:hypothetical protein D3C81_1258650 [compost metagenome]